MLVEEPPPQSMTATKSLGAAAGLSSVKVATTPLKGDCSPAEKFTGDAVMTLAPAGPAARMRRMAASPRTQDPANPTTQQRKLMNPLLIDLISRLVGPKVPGSRAGVEGAPGHQCPG